MKKNSIILIVLVFWIGVCFSQKASVTVTKGAAISVSKNTDVVLTGNLVNNSVIVNNKNSSWVINGSNQTITGDNETNFANVVFDFTGTLQVTKALTINGDANFKKGVVNMAGGTTLFFGPQASSTAVETSYVNGIVQKKGMSNFIYPFGYQGRGKRLRISNIKNGDANTLFTIMYYRAQPPNAASLSPELYELNHLDYYDIKPSGNETAILELEVDTADYPAGVPLNTDALRLAHYTNNIWQSEGIFSNNVFDYGVKSSGSITSFSPFALAAIRPRVLIISKVALQVQRQNENTAVVSWQALGTVEGVKSAVLQRSTAVNNNWVNIKDVTGTVYHGSYIDDGLDANDYFYRLKIAQNTGDGMISNIAMVRITNSLKLKVYPTLTHAEVNVQADVSQQIKMIEVIASNGAKVQQVTPVGNSHKLNLSGLAAGMYQLKIYTGQTYTIVRVVKY